MGKRHAEHPVEKGSFLDDFLECMDSSEGQQSIEAHDLVFDALENAGVDPRQRKIVWDDGQRLSIQQSAERIHAGHTRFSDPVQLAENMHQLIEILDDVFGEQPMSHWYEVFNGVHVTFGAVRGRQDVINDPQLRLNDIVVPLEGAGGRLTSTISSPIQVHGVAKVPAKRGPEIGEHNDEILRLLGFDGTEIDGLRASRAVPDARGRAA